MSTVTARTTYSESLLLNSIFSAVAFSENEKERKHTHEHQIVSLRAIAHRCSIQ